MHLRPFENLDCLPVNQEERRSAVVEAGKVDCGSVEWRVSLAMN